MGTLRNKMIDAMNLRRFSPRTQESYLNAVSSLAKFYNIAPDQLDAHKIHAYLLHLTVERGLSWSSCNVAVSAFRFFYLEVLGWDRINLPIPARKKPTRLPRVYSFSKIKTKCSHRKSRLRCIPPTRRRYVCCPFHSHQCYCRIPQCRHHFWYLSFSHL